MELISSVVTFAAAFVLGVLEQRSPKKDWKFIQRWPWLVLFFISTVVGAMEQAKEQARVTLEQYPLPTYVCVTVSDVYGIPTQKCDWVTKPGKTPPAPSLSPVFDLIGGIFVSVLVDIPFELAGLALGKGIAKRGESTRIPA